MWGFNLYTEGHFDLYIADYYDYKVRFRGQSLNRSLYTGFPSENLPIFSQCKDLLSVITCTGGRHQQ